MTHKKPHDVDASKTQATTPDRLVETVSCLWFCLLVLAVLAVLLVMLMRDNESAERRCVELQSIVEELHCEIDADSRTIISQQRTIEGLQLTIGEQSREILKFPINVFLPDCKCCKARPNPNKPCEQSCKPTPGPVTYPPATDEHQDTSEPKIETFRLPKLCHKEFATHCPGCDKSLWVSATFVENGPTTATARDLHDDLPTVDVAAPEVPREVSPVEIATPEEIPAPVAQPAHGPRLKPCKPRAR